MCAFTNTPNIDRSLSTATIQEAAIACIAAVKLNSRGEQPDAWADCRMLRRIILYANRCVHTSRHTISGVLHRSTSMSKVILIARISNSASQRPR